MLKSNQSKGIIMKFKLHLIGIFLVTNIVFAQNALIHHKIDAKVNPSDSFLEVTDEITIPENRVTSELKFKLHNAITVTSLTEAINIELINKDLNAKDVGMDREESESSNVLLLNEYKIVFPDGHSGDLNIILEYSGKIDSPVEQSLSLIHI